MTKVVIDMTMSLDGFVAGPDDGKENPLGKNEGMRIFDWYFSGKESYRNELFRLHSDAEVFEAREIAVKAALGASRGRIVRQLLTESFVLSTMGAGLGLTVGILGMQALFAMYPNNLAWLGPIGVYSIDRTVLGFTLLVTVVTATLAGLFPAWHASGFDFDVVLKQGTTRSGMGCLP